jgi:histidinol-phosphatase (PHP family)
MENLFQHPNPKNILHDYHVHSHFSCDAEASMDAMCQAAITAGICELGFSDHFDLHPNEPFRDYLDPESWWQSFEKCRNTYSSAVTLRAGVEVGEPHRFPQDVQQLLQGYPWDYVLGSLHWVGDTCVFDRAFFQKDEHSTYLAYFRELECLVDDGDIPQDVGFGLGSLETMVKSMGYCGLAQFERRRGFIVEFDD